MIRVEQLKLRIPHTEEQLSLAIEKALRIKGETYEYQIVRQSLDARKKPELFYVYTVDVIVKNRKISDQKRIARSKNKKLSEAKRNRYQFPQLGDEKLNERPVIVGTGPAGLFCGLMLARHGYRPILLERGCQVERRQKDVEQFWESGMLHLESNVQFGEGGAGTFSDGKLNTLVKDEKGRNQKVLEEFVRAGAKEEILYQQKPHIGTDVLKTVVKHIRQEIESFGGEVRFESKVTGFEIANHSIQRVIINQKDSIPAHVVVLAIGHSARDTFFTLKELGIPMQAKAFAVGVRIEHPQSQINLAQYGIPEADYLEAADYKLTTKSSSGRGVYSFCMCPGGYVVNASSEQGRLAVNGMSYSQREGKNANSAIIVTVNPDDFGSQNVLAGVEFQRTLEENAYQQGQGRIPVQLYKDFKANQSSKAFGKVLPQMKGHYQLANVRAVFPEFLAEAMIEGIEIFGKKITDFSRGDCLLSAVESRTSSPIRISRNTELQSTITGLYPCGEGAGYAGGITSAAMDGIRVAEAIARQYRRIDHEISGITKE